MRSPPRCWAHFRHPSGGHLYEGCDLECVERGRDRLDGLCIRCYGDIVGWPVIRYFEAR